MPVADDWQFQISEHVIYTYDTVVLVRYYSVATNNIGRYELCAVHQLCRFDDCMRLSPIYSVIICMGILLISALNGREIIQMTSVCDRELYDMII